MAPSIHIDLIMRHESSSCEAFTLSAPMVRDRRMLIKYDMISTLVGSFIFEFMLLVNSFYILYVLQTYV